MGMNEPNFRWSSEAEPYENWFIVIDVFCIFVIQTLLTSGNKSRSIDTVAK